MATPDEILQRYADRPLVQRLVRRPRLQVTAPGSIRAVGATMIVLAKARGMLPVAAIRPAANRPSTAASLERLRTLRARFVPQR